MIFAKVDTRMPTHRRFVAAGPAAVGFWTAALCYSRGEELDGALPREALGLILGLGETAARALADRLVEVGLFERDGDGYVILKYAEHNETKAQIKERRKATKKRVTEWRRNNVRNGVTPPVTNASKDAFVPGSGSASGSVDLREGVQWERPSTARLAADGAMGMSADCWMDGVRSVTGQPFVGMTIGHRATLVEALKARCPAGTEITEWARRQGAAFAKAYQGKKLSVLTFTDWLNTTQAKEVNPYDGEAVREQRARRAEEDQRVKQEGVITAAEALGGLLRPTGPKKAS